MSLKRLAELVLARNQPRNSGATEAEQTSDFCTAELREKLREKRPAELRYSLKTDTESDPEDVILTLAIRDVGVCELAIPKGKYDPFLILNAVDTLQ